MSIVKNPSLLEELRRYERDNDCCEEKLQGLRHLRTIYDMLGNTQTMCMCPECGNNTIMMPNRYDGQVGFDCDACNFIFTNDVEFTKVFTYNRGVLLGF